MQGVSLGDICQCSPSSPLSRSFQVMSEFGDHLFYAYSNAENAVVDICKLRGYCLQSSTGLVMASNKARFSRQIVVRRADNAEEFSQIFA